MNNDDLIILTADIVAAHVSNNNVAIGDIAVLVERVHGALAGLDSSDPSREEAKRTPAVSVRASVKPDHLICLECGSTQKTLKRHLDSAHGLTPQDYRDRYGLPAGYPMSAPNYAELRRGLAKKIGLGRKPKARAPKTATPEAPAKAKNAPAGKRPT